MSISFYRLSRLGAGPVLAAALVFCAVARGQAPEPETPPVQPRGLEETLRDNLDTVRPAAGLRFDLRAWPREGLPSAMAALMVGGREGGSILLSGIALPLTAPAASAPTGAPVTLVLEIEGASLLGSSPPIGPGKGIRVEVYVYAVSSDQSVKGFLGQAFRLDLDELGEAVLDGGIKLVSELDLPPGPLTLRVAVYQPETQRFGLRNLEVKVPGPDPGSGPGGAAGEPTLLYPFVAEPPAPWIVVSGLSREAGRGDPFAAAGLSVPSALPVLQGDGAEIELLAWDLPRGRPKTTATLLDLEGRPAATIGAKVSKPRPTAQSDQADQADQARPQRFTVKLDLDEVATGSYFLRLAAEGPGGRSFESPSLPLVVLRRSGSEGPLLWTDVQRRLEGRAARVEIPGDSGRAGRKGTAKRVRAVAGAYREVLALLAGGDPEITLDELVKIENTALEALGDNGLSLLLQAETQVVERLVAVDAEALIPVLALHLRAYQRYRDARAFVLASHSRRRVVDLTERYAAGGGTESSRLLASRVLAVLGAKLQTVQLRKTGHDLLARSLELNPENLYAMTHLAAGKEKTGDFGAALEVLERLVDLDPKSAEGRVRMAINLLRTRKEAEAEALLRRVIAEQNPPWSLTIAYQELGRVLVDSGRFAAAVDLLEQGVGRLPRQGRLSIQLAYALDRSGEARRAGEVLAELRSSPALGGSPRNLYHRWPEIDTDEIGRQLAAAAMIRLPTLNAALSKLPGSASQHR